jgi:Phage integrase family
VPFNAAAVEVITRQQGKHPVQVFTYDGNPVKQVSTRAWYKALKRAGIEAFRFHDLRHTCASWHVQNGTPLHVLQELGGWETPSMVRRYAHLAADHLTSYVVKVELRTGTNPSPPGRGRCKAGIKRRQSSGDEIRVNEVSHARGTGEIVARKRRLTRPIRAGEHDAPGVPLECHARD